VLWSFAATPSLLLLQPRRQRRRQFSSITMTTNHNGNDEESASSIDDAAAAIVPPATPPRASLPHILCVGIAALDAIATADHFPSPDEKMRSNSLSYHGGGNAANTACGIGRQHELIQCSLLGGVGDDQNGAMILQSLRDDHHVNIDLCQTWSNSPSPFSYILVVGDTRTSIHQPANGGLTIEHVQAVLPPSSSFNNNDDDDDDALHQFRAVHFDGRHPTAAVYLAERCHRLGIPFSLDVERPREGLDLLLQYASLVIVNESYCQNVVQPDHDDDLPPIHVKLRTVMARQAPRAVYAIQTMGARGCCLVRLQQAPSRRRTTTSEDRPTSPLPPPDSKGEQRRTLILPGTGHVPAVERHDDDDYSYALYCGSFRVDDVADTTGAGDAFQAGLLAALWSLRKDDDDNNDNDDDFWRHLDDVSLGRLLRIGNRFASESIRRLGARDGLPSFATDEFLRTELAELRQRRRPTSSAAHPIPHPPLPE
jgi:sugar/nucleoside kinase (ribokinase family)